MVEPTDARMASDADLARWTRGWQAALDAARRKGHRAGQVLDRDPVIIGPGATREELAAVEAATGLAIPATLRRLFEVARSAETWWHLADGVEPPEPFGDLFAGGFEWSIDRAVAEVEAYRGGVETVFPDPDDPYDAVWHAKYPWLSVPNGDIVALDHDGRVVYLSHDDGAGHGAVLGPGIVGFLDRWTPLGCPGPEDWQWLPFLASGGLDPDGGPGRAWRSWFGIP